MNRCGRTTPRSRFISGGACTEARAYIERHSLRDGRVRHHRSGDRVCGDNRVDGLDPCAQLGGGGDRPLRSTDLFAAARVKGRLEILKVHSRTVKAWTQCRFTPALLEQRREFSGADLASD